MAEKDLEMPGRVLSYKLQVGKAKAPFRGRKTEKQAETRFRRHKGIEAEEWSL